MKLTGFALCYNESSRDLKGIRRTLGNLTRICDAIVVYDDCSNDGSYRDLELFAKEASIPVNILKGERHYGYPTKPQKKLLLDYALKKHPDTDYFCWLDLDEVFTQIGTDGDVRCLAEQGLKDEVDAFWFKEETLWMSNCWKRVDMLFDKGWFPRLWRNNGQLSFTTEDHFHPIQWPLGIKKEVRVGDAEVIHYALNNRDKLVQRYKNRKALGMPLWYLEQMVHDEPQLVEIPNEVFPQGEVPELRDDKPEWISVDLSKLEAKLR